ncbi:MAG: flippase-like domain-containing protein [Sinobacteraceae bacterium]|nr:flippase-like domain-containing protein [Nevskiaceae bacterium]
MLLAGLIARADLPGLLQALSLGGAQLLWLVPYRVLFFLLYAIGWRALLRPYDPEHRAGVGYLFWVSAVRESIDRLLPVASVGGSVIGVRLLRWRGIASGPAAATVVVEILLTLLSLWLFMVLALSLLIEHALATGEQWHAATALRLAIPASVGLFIPIFLVHWLRRGDVFGRIAGQLRHFSGLDRLSSGAASLDTELRACLGRLRPLAGAGVLEFLALLSGSLENWYVLRLLGHPIDLRAAIAMEGLSVAARQLAFVIPGGLGVQEGSLMLLGHSYGINAELALALSLAKRMREVLCALPALLSWQWLEMRRLRGAARGQPE